MSFSVLRSASLALGLACAGMPGIMQAQDRDRDSVMATTDARNIVRQLARITGEFKEHFDDAVRHTDVREDRARRAADDLHDQAKHLEDVYRDKHDRRDHEVREQVDRTLAAGSSINRIMEDHRFTDRLQHDWGMLRSQLNALAEVYSLSPLR